MIELIFGSDDDGVGEKILRAEIIAGHFEIRLFDLITKDLSEFIRVEIIIKSHYLNRNLLQRTMMN